MTISFVAVQILKAGTNTQNLDSLLPRNNIFITNFRPTQEQQIKGIIHIKHNISKERILNDRLTRLVYPADVYNLHGPK